MSPRASHCQRTTAFPPGMARWEEEGGRCRHGAAVEGGRADKETVEGLSAQHRDSRRGRGRKEMGEEEEINLCGRHHCAAANICSPAFAPPLLPFLALLALLQFTSIWGVIYYTDLNTRNGSKHNG